MRLLTDPAWARTLALKGQRQVYEQFTFGQRVAKEEQLCREILGSWRR